MDPKLSEAAEELGHRIADTYPPQTRIVSVTTIALIRYRHCGESRTAVEIGLDRSNVPTPLDLAGAMIAARLN